MKRHNALIELSRDHHSGLILAQVIRKNAPVYKGLPSDTEGKRIYAVNSYNNELKSHFLKEEEILIPLVSGRDKSVDSITKTVLKQHVEIAALVAELEGNIDAEENLERLGLLLGDHIRLEEREWFEKIQQVFPEDELQKIAEKLKKS